MEGSRTECCHHLPQCSPQRDSPTPKRGNILHSTDQTNSGTSSLSDRAQNQAQTWIFSPRSPRGCVSICRSRTSQTGRNPKLEVSFNIFDPHNVPDNILAAGTTFCQEVHGLVGRGQLSGHHGTPGAVSEPNPKSCLCLPSGEGWCRVHIWSWASDSPDLESSSG